MNKLFIADFLILSILAFVNVKFIPLQYKILSIIVWVIIILLSIFINFNLILYFVSLLIIGLCIVVTVTINTVSINQNNKIVFWLLYIISTIILVTLIISKKIIYDVIVSDGQVGEKGIIGKQGAKGNGYFLTNTSEKAYNTFILNIEDVLKKYKPLTNSNDYLLQNIFFKDIIKNICYSEEFIDTKNVENGMGNKLNNDYCQVIPSSGKYQRTCFGEKIVCNTDEDCTQPLPTGSSNNKSCFSLQFPTEKVDSSTTNVTTTSQTIHPSCLKNKPTEQSDETEENTRPQSNGEVKLNDIIIGWVNTILKHSSGFIFLNTVEHKDTFFDLNNPITKVNCGKEKKITKYGGDNPFKSINDNNEKIENHFILNDGTNYGNPYYWGINKI
jgi:hypothetical protein